MIDPSSPVPVYHQLKTVLLAEIADGLYPSGVRLPTELELCAAYSISRTPARRALAELAAEGVIDRFRRRGSFVSADWMQSVGPHGVAVLASGPDEARRWRELTSAVGRGAAPDVAVVPSGWVAELADLGIIAPLRLEEDPLEPTWVPEAVRATWERGDATFAAPVDLDLVGLWLRRDALSPLGGRTPRDWGELRTIALAARDLRPEVSSPLVLSGGSAGGSLATFTTWLFLTAAGVGFAGAGPAGLSARRVTAVFGFLRRLIDHGLMSPDVIGYDEGAIRDALEDSTAVAGVATLGALPPGDEFVFMGLPGAGGATPGHQDSVTMAVCEVAVRTEQSSRPAAAEKAIVRLRTAGVRRIDPLLLASAHPPPVTPHYRLLAEVTRILTEQVISGSRPFEAVVGEFIPAARALTG